MPRRFAGRREWRPGRNVRGGAPMRIIGAPAKQANPRTANKTLRPVSKALTPEFLDELEGLFRKYGHLGTRTAITRAIVRDGTVPYADRIITE
ncbi:MAG: hypothetical protein PHH08_04300 [Candidatus ainarchaeum sp.]|nr:hypothetical protein [Candidatus ainarchaeum sp.]